MGKIIISVLISILLFNLVGCSERINSEDSSDTSTNVNDITSNSKGKNTTDIKELPKGKQEMSNADSVYFDYDKERFELTKIKGWDDITLWDIEKEGNFVVVTHLDNRSAKEIVTEKLEESEIYDDELEQVESDLKVESLKLIDYYREYADYMNDKDTYELVKFMYMYFIDDGNGGVYRIVINASTFDTLDDTAKQEFLQSIKIMPLSENDNMKNIKVLDEPPAKKVAS